MQTAIPEPFQFWIPFPGYYELQFSVPVTAGDVREYAMAKARYLRDLPKATGKGSRYTNENRLQTICRYTRLAAQEEIAVDSSNGRQWIVRFN